MGVIVPGAVRVRSHVPDAVAAVAPFVAGRDLIVEVQQRDGEWIPLRGVTAATIRLDAENMATGGFEIELCGLDVWAPVEAVLWREVKP